MWYLHDITGDVNLNHLVKVVFSRFLLCKVTIFLFPYFIFGSDSLSSAYPQSRKGNERSFLF